MALAIVAVTAAACSREAPGVAPGFYRAASFDRSQPQPNPDAFNLFILRDDSVFEQRWLSDACPECVVAHGGTYATRSEAGATYLDLTKQHEYEALEDGRMRLRLGSEWQLFDHAPLPVPLAETRGNELYIDAAMDAAYFHTPGNVAVRLSGCFEADRPLGPTISFEPAFELQLTLIDRGGPSLGPEICAGPAWSLSWQHLELPELAYQSGLAIVVADASQCLVIEPALPFAARGIEPLGSFTRGQDARFRWIPASDLVSVDGMEIEFRVDSGAHGPLDWKVSTGIALESDNTIRFQLPPDAPVGPGTLYVTAPRAALGIEACFAIAPDGHRTDVSACSSRPSTFVAVGAAHVLE